MHDYSAAKTVSAIGAQLAAAQQVPTTHLSAIAERLGSILRRADETSNVLRGNMDRIFGSQPEAEGKLAKDSCKPGALGDIQATIDRIEAMLDSVEEQSRRLHAL